MMIKPPAMPLHICACVYVCVYVCTLRFAHHDQAAGYASEYLRCVCDMRPLAMQHSAQ
jgi:hypothetical protein